MFPLLYKYLMLHDQVCIPGLGRFYKERTPARHDFINRVFLPPTYTIHFREETVRADRQLFSFIGRENGIDEVEAIRKYHDFSYKFNDHVRHYSQTELPGIGIMKRASDGSLNFAAEDMLHKYFVATPAARIVRRDATHTLLVGDTETNTADVQVRLNDGEETKAKSRWWIWAIVLGAAAIAAIAFYYMQYGNVRM